MAEIVMAYSASHAPMMTADPGSAPRQQAENFFSALEKVRDRAKETGVQAIVMMTGEHFTNFFLNDLPQIAVGLDEEHLGPPEVWLQVPKKMVPSDAGLAAHITASLIEQGQQPALAHGMKIDHGFMTVYYWLDRTMELPMVPIVVNCTTPPLMTTKQFYDFGVAVGNAIRSYDGLERVGLVAGGGLSHFVGEPRVGDIDEEFDRWFLERLGKGDLSEILDMPNDELMEAGNGTGEVRAWIALAGAMNSAPGQVLAYEPVYEWINGMGVVLYEGDRPRTEV
jgi:aromatic ring-opening dioxygenase catalytic subunit (LigB family)